MKKILVTGGAGFIGSHVCKALARAGYLPIVYDNLQHGHSHFVKWGPLIEGDLCDEPRLYETLKAEAPVGVIHMAALTDLRASVKDPASYYKVNVSGSIALLRAMQLCDIRYCIFSSTAAIFGIPEKIPIDESSIQQPISPYGYSKWIVERILKDFERAYNLRFAALRYFNAAGADPEGELGENHSPPSHLIPIVLEKALFDRGPLSVFGNQYPTKDGSAIRDYIHVSDLAAAHVKALEYIMKYDQSLSLNLGSGEGYSVLEVIKQVEATTKKHIPIVIQEAKIGDPHTLVCNNLEAKKILGWSPEHSSLANMVETSYAWQKRQ